MSFTSITDEELVNMGVTGLDDTPELSTEEMQAQFDEYPRFLKDKFRTHITEEEANTAAGNIGATIPEELTNVTDEKVQPILNELASRSGSQASTITSHLADTSNPHSVTKAQVGLGNCDNTSDLNKPISTATQTALNGKAPTNHASSSDTYGKSTSSNFGHSKLTDTYKSNNPSDIKSANDGIGASQKGLNDAYKDLLGMIESAGHGDMLKENYDPNGDYIIDIAQGGTNANTAAQARTNLGLGSVATENTVPVNKGGSGLTSSPSMLTNLGSTSADTIMKASPRPGVTGTLPIANGGTGQTTAAGIRNALGLGNTTDALPVANGGTGLTSQPSMLTNLGSTSADTIMKASPRPGVTGTLPVSNGGTGLTSQPSMLTNLGSTSADTIMKASPRPGVTGTLPLANGGTGAADAETARTNLHVPTTDKVSDNAPYLLRKSKGNLADIVLEGYSLPVNQLVQNGEFSNGSTGWQTRNSSTISVSNGVATITPSSANSLNLTQNGVVHDRQNHKFFCSVWIKATSATIKVTLQNNDVSVSKQLTGNGSWQKLSFVYRSLEASETLCFFNVSNTNAYDIKLVNIIDLTQEFQTDIADHIYSKELASTGSGIAWIKSYGFFSKDYEPFNLGSTQSVKTSGRKVVGKNLVDGLEIGTFAESSSAGSTYEQIKATDPARIRTKNLIPTFNNVTISCDFNNYQLCFCLFDEYGRYLGSSSGFSGWKTQSTAPTTQNRYIAVVIKRNDNANMTDADFVNCKLQIEFGTTATVYEPYTSATVALPNEDLRGILKRDGDNLYADGDTDIGIGNKNVRFGLLDLGTLNYTVYNADNHIFVTSEINTKAYGSNIICDKYVTTDATFATMSDKTLKGLSNDRHIYIRDTSYSNAATFKTVMDGVYLVYELATPTIESSTPWQNPQRAYLDGTEEFIDDREVPLPVGHTSVYQLNETLPPIEDYVDGAVKNINYRQPDMTYTVTSQTAGSATLVISAMAIPFDKLTMFSKIVINHADGGKRVFGYSAYNELIATKSWTFREIYDMLFGSASGFMGCLAITLERNSNGTAGNMNGIVWTSISYDYSNHNLDFNTSFTEYTLATGDIVEVYF